MGGMEAWRASGKAHDSILSISPARFSQCEQGSKLQVIDARSEQEFETGHWEGAKNISLDRVRDCIAFIDDSREAYIYCAGGYCSMILGSFLKRSGFSRVVNIAGGYDALKAYF